MLPMTDSRSVAQPVVTFVTITDRSSLEQGPSAQRPFNQLSIGVTAELLVPCKKTWRRPLGLRHSALEEAATAMRVLWHWVETPLYVVGRSDLLDVAP